MKPGMVSVRLNAFMPVPPAVAFGLIGDHAAFLSGPPIRGCRLLREGTDDPNGLGAVREVRALGLRFVEDIIEWTPPYGYVYRVSDVTLPAEHDHGRLTLAAEGEGTRVFWETHYRMTGPLGPLLTPLSMPVFRVLFGGILRRTARRLAGAAR